MDARLEQLKNELAEKSQASKRLREVREALSELDRRLDELALRLRREEKDVDRLEGVTFASAYHTILGDMSEALAKERGEALHAKELHARVLAQKVELDTEKRALLARLTASKGAEERFAEHLRTLERELGARDPILRERLEDLGAREADLRARDQRLHGALMTAERAKGALERVREALSTANGWGKLDLLGGGLIVTAAKHGNIDRARSNFARAESALRELNRQLEGTLEPADAHLGLDIGCGLSLADYFLDGLIVDWTVQTRIHAGLEQVRAISTRVGQIGIELSARQKRTRRALTEVRFERQELVERES
jgi:DNA repair exonuclease SbcCD ATPase subunit